jgi:hypothetical protein
MRRTKCVFAVAAIIAGLLTGASAALPQTLGNPQVVPPDSVEFGNTYGEWSARWWQWILSVPADKNPNLDATGAHCAEAQTGQVWFLAGGFPGGPPGPLTRSCTIPAGTDLLLPLNNTLFGELGTGPFSDCPQGPNVDCDPTALRESARKDISARPAQKVTIDHVQVKNLDQYRVTSPVFTVFFPEDAVLGLGPTGAHGPVVSDGFFLLIEPLSQGSHTIQVSNAHPPSGPFDVTYLLTVKK